MSNHGNDEDENLPLGGHNLPQGGIDEVLDSYSSNLDELHNLHEVLIARCEKFIKKDDIPFEKFEQLWEIQEEINLLKSRVDDRRKDLTSFFDKVEGVKLLLENNETLDLSESIDRMLAKVKKPPQHLIDSALTITTLAYGSLNSVRAMNPDVKAMLFNKELDNAEKKVRKLETEKQSLTESLKIYTTTDERCNNLQNELDTAQKKLDIIKEQMNDSQKKVAEQFGIVANLRLDIQSQKKQLEMEAKTRSENTSRLDDANITIEAHQQTINRLESEVAEKDISINNLTEDKNNETKRADHKSQLVLSLEKEKRETAENLAKVQKDLQALYKERDEWHIAEENSHGQLTDMTTARDNLVIDKADVECQLAAMTTAWDNLAIEKADIVFQLAAMITARDDVNRQLAAMITARDDITTARDDVNCQLAAMTTARDDITTARDDANRQLAAMTTARDDANRQLAAMTTARDDANRQLAAMTTARDDANRQLAAITTARDDANRQLAAMTTARDDSISAKARLDIELSATVKDRDAVAAEKAAADKKLAATIVELDDLVIAKADVDNQLAAITKARDQLINGKADTDDQLVAVTKERDSAIATQKNINDELSAIIVERDILTTAKATALEERDDSRNKAEEIKFELQTSRKIGETLERTLMNQKNVYHNFRLYSSLITTMAYHNEPMFPVETVLSMEHLPELPRQVFQIKDDDKEILIAQVDPSAPDWPVTQVLAETWVISKRTSNRIKSSHSLALSLELYKFLKGGGGIITFHTYELLAQLTDGVLRSTSSFLFVLLPICLDIFSIDLVTSEKSVPKALLTIAMYKLLLALKARCPNSMGYSENSEATIIRKFDTYIQKMGGVPEAIYQLIKSSNIGSRDAIRQLVGDDLCPEHIDDTWNIISGKDDGFIFFLCGTKVLCAIEASCFVYKTDIEDMRCIAYETRNGQYSFTAYPISMEWWRVRLHHLGPPPLLTELLQKLENGDKIFPDMDQTDLGEST
ncbi:hypothetical protein BELL_0164g00090 [Botrytis elliptica]|uniref:Uncharacterized protein n=1 Tax=Botrytis elliptica TaxID=278938 RepID=A0A4Z1JX91_9HELO|nr:hypothetical protein EAE99_009461 [Botrytis elliptica]TGO76280.1 hypothetical protein BELL_0164g00090 [Botrytis elliptica]